MAIEAEMRELYERLYGHYPPQGEDDVGDIGHLRRDVAEVKKSVKFFKGIPGWITKGIGILIGVKTAIDLFFPQGFNPKPAVNLIVHLLGLR